MMPWSIGHFLGGCGCLLWARTWRGFWLASDLAGEVCWAGLVPLVVSCFLLPNWFNLLLDMKLVFEEREIRLLFSLSIAVF